LIDRQLQCDFDFMKTNTSSCWRGDCIFKHISGLGMSKNLVMGPYRARNLERPCWWGPAAIHATNQLKPRVWDRKIWIMDPTGSKTKNDCADKGQQQFTSQLEPIDGSSCKIPPESWDRKIRSWVPWDPQPKMTVPARASSNLPELDRKMSLNQKWLC
jgi:hypothetical protein